MVFVGIDVGTQGARAVAVNESGDLLCEASHSFAPRVTSQDETGLFEQDPTGWWEATQLVCRRIIERLSGELNVDKVGAVGITSTSGTLVLVGADGNPITPAIMYSDSRGNQEAEFLNCVAPEYCGKLGVKFSSSSSLAKALWWWKRHKDSRLRWFLSPTDFLNAKLTGQLGVMDFTNALKMGYDLVELRWPDFIQRETDLPVESLPKVVRPGSIIGEVTETAARLTGLPTGTPVIAGLTDGCASQFAAGAVCPGDWSSTLGTTLVVKGVTQRLLTDPEGRVYCHRHPYSGWLPGGASNVGARDYPLAPEEYVPTPTGPGTLLTYPLKITGERFPFRSPHAHGFTVNSAAAGNDRVAGAIAFMEGEAYIERMAFALLRHLGAEVISGISSVGGASKNDTWMQIRAHVLGLPFRRPTYSSAAMGVSMLAAAECLAADLKDIAERFVRFERTFEPDLRVTERYFESYSRFLTELHKRGFIKDTSVYTSPSQCW